MVDTLNEDGTLSADAQIYVGEDRFAARKKIIAELKEKGFLTKEEDYQTRNGDDSAEFLSAPFFVCELR